MRCLAPLPGALHSSGHICAAQGLGADHGSSTDPCRHRNPAPPAQLPPRPCLRIQLKPGDFSSPAHGAHGTRELPSGPTTLRWEMSFRVTFGNTETKVTNAGRRELKARPFVQQAALNGSGGVCARRGSKRGRWACAGPACQRAASLGRCQNQRGARPLAEDFNFRLSSGLCWPGAPEAPPQPRRLQPGTGRGRPLAGTERSRPAPAPDPGTEKRRRKERGEGNAAPGGRHSPGGTQQEVEARPPGNTALPVQPGCSVFYKQSACHLQKVNQSSALCLEH